MTKDSGVIKVKDRKEFLAVPFDLSMKSISEKKEDGGHFAYFEGYGSTFGNLDLGDDIVAQGAFTKTLQSGRKIKMLWQHNYMTPIGSYPQLREDSKGLFVQGRINLGTEKGQEGYALLKAGDMDSMSIGFRTIDSEYNSDTDVRVLKELDLFEISLVTQPMNEMALVTAVKSVEAATGLGDVTKLLREAGFSRNASNLLVSKIKSFAGQCNADPRSADTAIIDPRDAEKIGAKLDHLLITSRLDSVIKSLTQ